MSTAIRRKFMPGAVVEDSTLGDRQIRVIVSTPAEDRVKDVMEPEGCVTTDYKANPIVLADHDRRSPIGTAAIEVKSDRVEALITFAPAGISAKADEYCGLAKAGVLNTVSPGFVELERTPRKGGGVHVTKWALLELSLVTVPAQPEATVIARGLGEEALKVGASRNLPASEKAAWDPETAAASIFDHAGFDGDEPDHAFARKGFLVYDAAGARAKEAYRFPFAAMINGRLTVVGKGLSAAAEALAASDIPDDVRAKAKAVVEHYEAKMKDTGIRAKALDSFKRKDMYDVSWLAGIVQQLVSLAVGADYERQYEGDESVTPEMLADVARAAAEAYQEMSREELAELLARLPGATETQKAHVLEATGFKALLRYGELTTTLKAGAEFSAKNKKAIGAALAKIEDGHKCIKGMLAAGGEAEDTDDTSDEDPKDEVENKSAPPLSERERDLDLLRLKGVAA